MNLDELSQGIDEISAEDAARRLSGLLLAWKADDSTVDDLRDRIERYIGNAWVAGDEDHARVHALWSAFRDDAIAGIGGMTMNERLYRFGLFDRFDAAGEDERRTIYAKLHARP